ncbi:MAG TPA: hypothetical protein VK489_15685, partial [Ferruginibacter sp.]|nr:hypothetical protein [Ferruginibacter sp.]
MKMKIDFLLKRNLIPAFLFLTVLTLLVSCSKSEPETPATPPREQFVDYTVNGTATSIGPAVRGVVLHETDPFY